MSWGSTAVTGLLEPEPSGKRSLWGYWDRQVGRDQPGLWGLLAPQAFPPWPEPGRFLARPEMALPDVPLARGAQGRSFAALIIVTPFFCPSWGHIMSSRGQRDTQYFPPCHLWTAGTQLGAPSPFAPSWGEWAQGCWAGSRAPLTGCSGPHRGSGASRAMEWCWEQVDAWDGGLGSVAQRCSPGSILQAEQPSCLVPSPAMPVVAGRVGTW